MFMNGEMYCSTSFPNGTVLLFVTVVCRLNFNWILRRHNFAKCKRSKVRRRWRQIREHELSADDWWPIWNALWPAGRERNQNDHRQLHHGIYSR